MDVKLYGPPIVPLVPARSALALSGPPRTVSRCPAATHTACPPHVVPCCSLRVTPSCPAQRAELGTALPCPAARALRCHALRPARRPALQLARRTAPRVVPCCSPRVALCCSARNALLKPARRALLPCASCPAAASASRPAAARASRSSAPRVAPCCPVHHAPCPTARAPPCRPVATTATAAARATAAVGGGAAGSAGSAAGAGGAKGATGSAGGAVGAGGAGPTVDRHRLSWPLSRQLQWLGVNSGGHCLSRTTPPLSNFASGELVPQRCVTGFVEAAALGASESAAALGATESDATLGASESAAAPYASESAAALGAPASPATGPSSTEALHIFTLDSGMSRCFFCDCTTLTPHAAPVPVSLADPTEGPVVARASTVLPCPAVPSGSLSGLHLPTFSTNLVSNSAIQDVWADTFIHGGQRVAISMCYRTGRHLATFTRQPGSSLYTLTTASAQVAEAGQVAASSQVSASGQLAASCSCQALSHQILLWHHRLGHPSLLCLRSMHSLLLVSGLPRSLPSLPCSLAPPCLPCVEGRQRAAPHSSEFPPTTAPLQTLHVDVWGPAPDGGTDQERYFLLVVDDYTRYTTVFPLRHKADVSGVLIPWIRATRRQLRERFRRDFQVPRLHSDRGDEFSSDLLAEFCRDEGIHRLFTLPDSPHQNGIAERRIALIMELNLWFRVSEPKTSPTLWWMGKVGDASVFRVWGALSLVRDATASKLSSRTLRCVFLGFPTDTPPWQFYHPRKCRVFSSQDVTFDESVCFYRLHPHASHPVPLAPLFLVPVSPSVDPLPPQGPAPSGVSQVDPPPLVEPLEISSETSGPAEGGDLAADDTAATRRSPHLEDLPAEFAGAKPGGAETEGEGSGGAATRVAGSGGAETGGADSGGAASPSGGGAVGDPPGGPGAGQPLQLGLLETLSPQVIRVWTVRRGIPGGGGYGPAGAGAASPGGTADAGGIRGTVGGAGGAAGAQGTRGAAGAGGAEATSPRGATGAGGTGGAGAAGPGGARTRGAGAAGAGGAAGAVGAGGATGAAGTGGARGTAGAGGAGTGGTGGAGAAGPGGARTRGAGAARAGGAAVRRMNENGRTMKQLGTSTNPNWVVPLMGYPTIASTK
ncbi:unnamed protein product [Closterium sp. NIES-54]